MLPELLKTYNHQRVILYGAGRIGKNVLEVLRNLNVAVDFFLDENRSIKEVLCTPVLAPEAYTAQPGDVVVLCPSSETTCNELEHTLKERGVTKFLRHSNVFGAPEAQEKVCPIQVGAVDVRTCRSCVVKGLSCKNPVAQIVPVTHEMGYIKQVALLVTTSCTLNCKECVARVPEYRTKSVCINLDLERFKKCWYEFRDAVGYVRQLQITGGEPFLYKDMERLITFLIDDPKIGILEILTTGTSVISDSISRLLSHEKIVVSVDDYGDNIPASLQPRFQENMQLLHSLGVNVVRIDNTNGTWHSVRKVVQQNRTAAQNVAIFRACNQAECRIITQDLKFEICGRSSKLEHLGYDTVDMNDSIDLCDKPANLLRDELNDYFKRPFLTCCEFCEGFDSQNIVRAGQQLDSCMPHSKGV